MLIDSELAQVSFRYCAVHDTIHLFKKFQNDKKNELSQKGKKDSSTVSFRIDESDWLEAIPPWIQRRVFLCQIDV